MDFGEQSEEVNQIIYENYFDYVQILRKEHNRLLEIERQYAELKYMYEELCK